MGSIQSLLLSPLLYLWEENDALKTTRQLLGMEEPEEKSLEQQIIDCAAAEGIRFASLRDIQVLLKQGWKGKALAYGNGSWTGLQNSGTTYTSPAAKDVLGWVRGEGHFNVRH